MAKKKADELTTEEAMRRLFPKKVREALKSEAERAKKTPKPSTKRKTT
jgi:hypothetical protein